MWIWAAMPNAVLIKDSKVGFAAADQGMFGRMWA